MGLPAFRFDGRAHHVFPVVQSASQTPSHQTELRKVMRPKLPITAFALDAEDLERLDAIAATLTAKSSLMGRVGSRADAVRVAIREYHDTHIRAGRSTQPSLS